MITELGVRTPEMGLGRPLDPGITLAVKLLRDAGIEPFEACEGGAEHAYPEPTVRFEASPAAAWRALDLLAAVNLPVRRLSQTWGHSELEDHKAADHDIPPFWEITFYEKLA